MTVTNHKAIDGYLIQRLHTRLREPHFFTRSSYNQHKNKGLYQNKTTNGFFDTTPFEVITVVFLLSI